VELRLDEGTVTGRLRDLDGDTVVLDVEGEERRLELGQIRSGRIVVELKRLGED
jgi:ribosome maturation factor RimP